MIVRAGKNQQQKGRVVLEASCSGFEANSSYGVLNEKNQEVGVDLLIVFYGKLWEDALDRLRHKIDGHLFDIHYKGKKFTVYRKIKSIQSGGRPYLRLVKS